MSSVHAASDTRIQKICTSLKNADYAVVLAARAPFNGPHAAGIKLPGFRNRLLRAIAVPAVLFFHALRFNNIHFHDPELLPLGLLLLVLRKNVIYDVHEDYKAQIMDKEWIPGPLRRLTATVVRMQERLFHAVGGSVIAATPHIACLFHPVRRTVVKNAPEFSAFQEPLPRNQRGIAVSFVGEVRPVRGADAICRTAEILYSKTGLQLCVAGRLAGMSAGQIKRFVSAPGIDYRGPVPYTEALGIMRNSVVGLVPFQPAGNNVNGLPSKIPEYFATGTPVVLSDFPVWRETFEPSGAAFFAPPHDPEQLAAAILAIMEHPDYDTIASGARDFVRQKYSWQIESQHLLEHYRQFVL